MDMHLRHAILGLLAIRPQSGYDLGRAFARTVAHFWYADQSQIYRTLTALESDGAIVTETVAQAARPDRRVHSLTETGRAELETWLDSPLETERAKEPFLARLFFAASLGPERVDELLAERERLARSALQDLAAIPTDAQDLASELRVATLRAGIAHHEAELDWLADTRRRLAAHRSES